MTSTPSAGGGTTVWAATLADLTATYPGALAPGEVLTIDVTFTGMNNATGSVSAVFNGSTPSVLLDTASGIF